MLLYLLSGAAGGCNVMLGFRFRFMRVPRFCKIRTSFSGSQKKMGNGRARAGLWGMAVLWLGAGGAGKATGSRQFAPSLPRVWR